MTAKECKEILLKYFEEADDLQDLAGEEQYHGCPLDEITSAEFFNKINKILDQAIEKEIKKKRGKVDNKEIVGKNL